MESKVTLYDSNDVKIGETFARRARQLVKQQRAIWLDDNHESIRFVPGAENMDAADAHEKDGASIPAAADSVPQDDDGLIALALRRIRERRRFVFHTIVFLPCWFLLFLFAEWFMHSWAGEMFFAFTSGVWLTLYIVHAYQFILPKFKKYLAYGSEREERRARRLAAEVASLKAEMQR